MPGEHDVFADGGTEYLNRFAAGRPGRGWQSFDYRGVHFVGLVNVLNFKAGGLGSLGHGAARVAGARRGAARRQHPRRRLRPRAALGGVPAVGLGDR